MLTPLRVERPCKETFTDQRAWQSPTAWILTSTCAILHLNRAVLYICTDWETRGWNVDRQKGIWWFRLTASWMWVSIIPSDSEYSMISWYSKRIWSNRKKKLAFNGFPEMSYNKSSCTRGWKTSSGMCPVCRYH